MKKYKIYWQVEKSANVEADNEQQALNLVKRGLTEQQDYYCGTQFKVYELDKIGKIILPRFTDPQTIK